LHFYQGIKDEYKTRQQQKKQKKGLDEFSQTLKERKGA
jgi:hypothetical protein